MEREIECFVEFNQTFHIRGANGIFKPRVVEFVQQATYLKRFISVVLLHRIVRQHEVGPGELAAHPDLIHMANVPGDRNLTVLMLGRRPGESCSLDSLPKCTV